MRPSVRSVAEVVRDSDFLRGRSPLDEPGGPHHEWLHFCVCAGELTVVINFSISESGAGERARLTMLVHGPAWDGAVETFEGGDVALPSGAIRLRLGENRLALADGEYRLDVKLRDRPIAARLSFAPLALPALSANLPIARGSALHWLAVPRLRAAGTVTAFGVTHRLDGALAYHDHNWGGFGFGQDFAWDWGFALPASPATPWSLVFARLTDRARATSWAQSLFLWRGARHERVLRDGDVSIRPEGLFRPRALKKFPPVMGLVSPGLASDVPARLVVEAAADGDWVRAELETRDFAQVVVPNDADLGVTVIHEVTAAATVRGEVRGEPVALEGHGVFELLGA